MKFNNLREVIRVTAQSTTAFQNAIIDGNYMDFWRILSKLHQLQKYIQTNEFKELKAIDTANQNTFRYELGMLEANIKYGKDFVRNRQIIKGGKKDLFTKWG